MSSVIIFVIGFFIVISLFGKKTPSGRTDSLGNSLPDFVCKHCGVAGSSSLAGIPCQKSPSKKHEIIAYSDYYVCKYCGMKLQNSMAVASCTHSPTKTHVLINSKSSYTCRFCGQTQNDGSFARTYCPRSSDHKHELID